MNDVVCAAAVIIIDKFAKVRSVVAARGPNPMILCERFWKGECYL